jgi:energy-coupling factor transporter ATP-binding protein EcfA2
MKIEIKIEGISNTLEIDSEKNTLLTGNNGTGKTRFLSVLFYIIKNIDKNTEIVFEELKSKYNVVQLRIDGKEYINENTADEQPKFLVEEIIFFLTEVIENETNNISGADLFHAKRHLQLLEGNHITPASATRLKLWAIRNMDNKNIETESRDYLYEIERNLNQYERTIFENRKNKKRNISSKFDVQNVRFIESNVVEELDFSYIFENYMQKLKNNIFKHVLEDDIESVKKQKKQNETNIREFNYLVSNYTNLKLECEQDIKIKCNNTNISFSKLSSGEKRLFHIFAVIIFTDFDLLIIDEPEISFSVNYQNKFISDLMDSLRNKNIIFASHAPFIVRDFIGERIFLENEIR